MSSFWGNTEQSPTSWRSQPSLRHGSKPERGWDRAKPPPGTELSLSPPQLFLPHRITCRARFKQNKISCHGYPEQDCYIYKEREKYRKYIRGAASHAFFFLHGHWDSPGESRVLPLALHTAVGSQEAS